MTHCLLAPFTTAEDHGSIVCTSCGLVICDSTVETGLNGEARSFKEDGGEFADSRTGGTFDPLVPVEDQMGTFIAGTGSGRSAIADRLDKTNRQTHTQRGLRAVEARCLALHLSVDATDMARRILLAVLQPPKPQCVFCATNSREATIHVALCGHGVCAKCEESGEFLKQKKACKVCSEPMSQRPHRLNVDSTHAAVIYWAAKVTPGSTRTAAEVAAGLDLTKSQFSRALQRVKVAAGSNSWLEQVMRQAAQRSELPQLEELLSRRLACLQVNWTTRCAALAALKSIRGSVRGHKGVTVVTAVVMLTLQHLGCDEQTALQQVLQVCPGTKKTIQMVANKIRADKRFDLGLPANSTSVAMTTAAEFVPTLPLSQTTSSDRCTGNDQAASPLPQPTDSGGSGGNRHLKRKRDGQLYCDVDSSEPVLPSYDTLPEGWERFFDETSNQWYYHHAKSGTTQWSLPSAQCTKRSRRVRAPREEVTAEMIRLFDAGDSYTVSALVNKLDQPKAYVKDILTEIFKDCMSGEYNRKDGTWRKA